MLLDGIRGIDILIQISISTNTVCQKYGLEYLENSHIKNEAL